MGTFSMQEADNYGQSNAGSFFQLKDDKDTAKVRFLYNTIDDVQGYAVHQVELPDGKKRYVNCLRNYNEPLDKCPLCAAGSKILPKLFLKMYNEDTQECQIWERGKSYFQKLASLSAHYNPLCNEVIEIERNGKKGDQKTEYMFYPLESSEINLDDYECPEPLGTIILDKTEDEIKAFMRDGEFPENGGDSELPFKEESTRRTPSNPQPSRRAF